MKLMPQIQPMNWFLLYIMCNLTLMLFMIQVNINITSFKPVQSDSAKKNHTFFMMTM